AIKQTSRTSTVSKGERTCGLESRDPSLLISNADRFVNLREENLAIADLSGTRGIHDRIYGPFHHVVSQYHFQFDFGNQIHGVLSSTIKLSMTFLPPVAAGLEHGHPFHTNLVEGGFHRFQ